VGKLTAGGRGEHIGSGPVLFLTESHDESNPDSVTTTFCSLDQVPVFVYILIEYNWPGGLLMPKTLTMRLDDATYETFVRAAKAERRSLANLVETAALRHVRETSFVDDSEMAEITSRPELVRRLKAGSRDARKRKGRIVAPL
jgi:hypothetical protein